MGIFKKKHTIDPVDFLVLRNELVELKERLDASEQSKASLEDRLSSLAATTMVLSSTSKSDTAEIVEQIEILQNRVETATAVSSKVDSLHQRLIDVEQVGGSGGGAPDLTPQLSELAARIDQVAGIANEIAARPPAPPAPPAPDITPQLSQLSARIDQVAEIAMAPVAPDEQLTARLDGLNRSAESVDLMSRQIGQLNARVAAQAEFGEQLKALSDRISVLQQRSVDSDGIHARLDELASTAPVADELADRVAGLAARLAAGEDETRLAREQATELELRLAEVTAASIEHLDQRLGEIDRRVDDDVTARLTEVQERIAANEQQAREQIAALESQTSVHTEAQIAQLWSRIGEQTTLSEQIAARVETQAHLDERVAQLQERIQELQTTRTDLEVLRDRVEQAVETSPETNEFGGRLDDLRHRIDELASAGDATDDVRTQLDAMQLRIDQVQGAQADIAAVRDRVEQVAGSASSNDRLDELAARVEQRLSDHAGRADDLTARIDAQATLHDQLAGLTARIDQLDERGSDIDDVRNELGTIGQRLGEIGERAEAGTQATAAVAELGQRLGEIAERVSLTAEDARVARDRAAVIEQRLANDTTSARIDGEFNEIKAQLEQQSGLADRVQSFDSRLSELRTRSSDVSALDKRVDRLAASIPSTDDLQRRLDEMVARVSVSEQDARTAREQAAVLEQRITANAASSSTDQIERRLDELMSKVAAQSSWQQQLATLDARVGDLGERGADSSLVDGLHDRLEQLAANVPDTDSIHAQITELASRVANNEVDARTAREQATALDERIDNVSAQLTNQLGELGSELDTLASREVVVSAALDEATVQSIKTGQVRLAAEQARYEIDFREDLAMLAEQVRQLRGRS